MPTTGERVFLAIDQGGHASRAYVFDATGRSLASGEALLATRRPRANWVEHDPAAVLDSVRDAIDLAVARLEAPAGIVAAGLATQRSSVICWDRQSGVPLSPVISWQDRRHQACIEALRDQEDEVRATTGLVLSAHYGASKLKWCLEHLPGVRAALDRGRLAWGPLASYLLYALLDERPLLVDPANASRTLLLDLASCEWSDEMLDLFGLPREPLPANVATEHGYGQLRLANGTVPLTACTGDQSAVPFVLGAPDGGTVFVNVGTGAFVQRVTGAKPRFTEHLLTGPLWRDSAHRLYTLEGTVNGAGSAIEHEAGELGLSTALAWELLDKDMPGHVPLYLNGIAGLGSPFWKPDFRSRFIGGGNQRERLCAVLESIVFLIYTNLLELEQALGKTERLLVNGGVARHGRVCQMLANLSGLEVHRPELLEATALGLSCLVAGRPPTWAPQGGHVFEPTREPALARRYSRWRSALQDAVTGRNGG